MTDKINDGGPAFAAWPEYGSSWAWGRIMKRTDKTVSVHEWRAWGGGGFGSRVWRKTLSECVLFDNQDDARALVKAISDLNNREADTRRQYAEKRKALIEAARAKGQTK